VSRRPFLLTFHHPSPPVCRYNFVNAGEQRAEGDTEIEGIGSAKITANFKKAYLDGALRGTDQEAVNMVYYLMRNEGLCIGPSSALNAVGAVKLALKLGPGRTIVMILCDSGERYGTKFFNPTWLAEKELVVPNTSSDLSFVREQ
jgi:cysteine synthase